MDVKPRQSLVGVKFVSLQLSATTQAVAWIRPSDGKRVYPIYSMKGEYQGEILEDLEAVSDRQEEAYQRLIFTQQNLKTN
jgi:hypothetical protein